MIISYLVPLYFADRTKNEHQNSFLFLSDFLLYHYSSTVDHYCTLENLRKNREKIRTNLEQYTLKIMKILRTASLGSNFNGTYKRVQQLKLLLLLFQSRKILKQKIRRYLCGKGAGILRQKICFVMFLIIFPRSAVYPNLLLFSFLNNGIPPVILRYSLPEVNFMCLLQKRKNMTSYRKGMELCYRDGSF